jgi:hypothetical protein
VVLTTLWCIWFHQNQILYEGKTPNPIDTILTSQSLWNRYTHPPLDALLPIKEAPQRPHAYGQIQKDWQLLMTTAEIFSKTGKRQGIAFVGKTRLGQSNFVGSHIIRAKDSITTTAITIREASLLATSLGFRNLILLTNSKQLEQIWSYQHQHKWHLTPILEDLKDLQHNQGCQFSIKVAPKIILIEAVSLATTAVQTFVNVTRVHLDLML